VGPLELLKAQELGKKYGFSGTWALDRVDLAVKQGEVYGLMGENGAGKTTFLRLVLGFLRPSTGSVKVEEGVGIGYVAERPSFWTTLTVVEHLSAVGRSRGVGGRVLAEALDSALGMAGLQGKAGARVSSLSKGMQQRLAIAQSTLGDPGLVILDEPASGLDPGGQREIRDMIQRLHRDGKTILLSSHYLVDLEMACTRVGILHHGKLVLDDSLENLMRRYSSDVEIGLDREPGEAEDEIRRAGAEVEISGKKIRLRGLDDVKYFALQEILLRHRLRVMSLGHPGILLERIFLDVARGGGQQ
jgi:ABC-2 type transport system ATP-binding protein